MSLPTRVRLRRRVLTAGIAFAVAAGAVAGSASAASASSFDLLALVRSAPAGSTLHLVSGSYTLHDFSSQSHGVTLGSIGVVGAGVGKTVVAMAPNSSTKAASVPTAAYASNPLYLVHTSGGTPGLSGFTLSGTAQGHLYGGLLVGKATNARVSAVQITRIPGNAKFPPGETYSLNDYRTVGSTYSGISIDGGGTSAVDFGANSSTNLTVSSSTFVGAAYSAGMTMWQTKNITLNDVALKNNRAGINFERASGAIAINRPVMSNNQVYDFQFQTDRAGASVIITNPVLVSGQKIRIRVAARYNGVADGQKRASIRVLVNGVDQTSALVQWL